MSQLSERIAQFRKMTNELPDDELGHYRLAQLLMEDGQFAEACKAFERTLELSPQFSKVYQLLGTCLTKLSQREEAIQILQKGFNIADERGDNIPRDEMSKLLVQLGEPAPVSQKTGPSAKPMGPGTGFQCKRPGCFAGSNAHQLPAPPMKDELGKKIYDNVCAECWNYWLRDLSIKVINEMRLDLSDEKSAETYDQILRDSLGLS